MQDKIDANRQAWNSRVAPHLASALYDLDTFRAGRCSLNPLELEAVGDVAGKSLLHLQCHFGQDTLSWARRGARVTGVDFSEEALKAARSLARELDLEARFLQANVLELELDERFDIVFTSYGVLGWLPDLERWADVVAGALKPGGRLCVVEFHPVLFMFDFESGRLSYQYFHQGYTETHVGTYAADDGVARTEHFWSHSLADIIDPLTRRGLVLTRFQEVDYSPYGCFPNMIEDEPGRWRYQAPVRLPHLFALTATAPEQAS